MTDRGDAFLAQVNARGLAYVMSAVKWRRLFDELEPLRAKMDFLRKDVTDVDVPTRWNADIFEIFGLCERIEWLEVRAGLTLPRGALGMSEVVDFTDELVTALRGARIPFERTARGVRIWGYIQPGDSPLWDDSAA